MKKCRYNDCIEGHPVASDDEQVTCPTCRDYLGLPPIKDGIDPYWRRMNIVVVERGIFGWKPVKELGIPTPMLIDLSNDGKYHEAWLAPLGNDFQWRARDDMYDAVHKPADVPYRMVMAARPPEEDR